MPTLCVITLFPEMFEPWCRLGVTGRALTQGKLQCSFVNPRDFAVDAHGSVDDRPYGGGPGMVMAYEPLKSALDVATPKGRTHYKVVALTPQGRRFDQGTAESMVVGPDLVLVCGRYEGIDERFVELCVDEEWSIGDYVMSGGEPAAMVIIDTLARLLPDVLGHKQSAKQDSFSSGLLDCPHYTRPESVQGNAVPKVLLSGDHEAIRIWRLKQSLGRTWVRRPEILEKIDLDDEKKRLLDEFIIEYRAKST